MTFGRTDTSLTISTSVGTLSVLTEVFEVISVQLRFLVSQSVNIASVEVCMPKSHYHDQ